jgi:ABC-type spermidine/putrescine transport system permease subunit I
MVLPPVAVIAVFIGYPVGLAIAYTLGKTGGPNALMSLLAQREHVAHHGVTLGAYREMLSNRSVQQDIWTTVWVTLVTVVVVVAVSWVIALYLRLSDTWIARAVSGLSVVPLFIPVVIASYSMFIFYGPDGFIRTVMYRIGFLGFPNLGYTTTLVTLGEIWVNIPFGVLMMTSGLNGVPNSLIEAARDSGASMPRVVRSVLFPLNVIPTVIVATFTGIYVLGSFTVPYLTGPNQPNLLGVSMSNFFVSFSQPQQAEVLAIIVFVLALALGATYVWANVRASRRAAATS